MENSEKENLELKAEVKALREIIQVKDENEKYLQDTLSEELQGAREQTIGYQSTIRFIVLIMTVGIVLGIILGMAVFIVPYFKYAYIGQ